MAQNPAFVVPWIKDYDRFTNLKRLHYNPSIGDFEMLERFVLPGLPESVDGKDKSLYTRLVDAMVISSSLRSKRSKSNKSQSLMVSLATYRLAARQDGRLCVASELFDHTDPVFSAAFGSEATNKFLMTEVQCHLSLWSELGIRRRERGRFKGEDYLACLIALQDRLNDFYNQTSPRDIETVLQPLCTSTATLSDLGSLTWKSIASLAVFPVSPVPEHEPQFRRLRMELLASQRQMLKLRDIVIREYAAVCWSQTPFALHEASTFSLGRIGSNGQPDCATVWQHLTFLAESARFIADATVESFIEDLRRTYEFLQTNLQQSKKAFNQPATALWLNIETTVASSIPLEALRSSWTSLEELLLDSPCDAPPLMTVQPFLGRFSSLLKDLGCKSLYYPPITPPSSTAAKNGFGLLRELWQEDILTDVKFEAEGSIISAHKLILASRSTYCKTQFHGPWASRSESKESIEVIRIEEMTYKTLRILVDFCYYEDRDWAADMRVKANDDFSVIEEKLDSLVAVLEAADRWLMADLHTDVERHLITGIRFFIRPDNVEGFSKIADATNARELWSYCEEYRLQNAEAVLFATDADKSSNE